MNRSAVRMMAVLVSLLLNQTAFAQTASEVKAQKTQPEGAEKNTEKASEKTSETKSTRSSGEGARSRKPTNNSISDIADIINGLDYPELQVVPRASERLRIEAKDEEDSWFFMHWPLELSGAATLLVGTMGKSQLREGSTDAQKADASSVSMVTTAVGAGWLAAGIVLGMKKPYRSGVMTISRLNGKDERTILLRERLAEEALEKPARLMAPLITASVITNLGMNLLMGSYLTDQGRIMAGVSATLAFLPWIFDDHTVLVWNKHLEYKKKIYGPLSSPGVGYEPRNQTFYPTANLVWQF